MNNMKYWSIKDENKNHMIVLAESEEDAYDYAVSQCEFDIREATEEEVDFYCSFTTIPREQLITIIPKNDDSFDPFKDRR